MVIKRVLVRFHQWGGIRLVKEYARLGVLSPISKTFLRCLVKKRPFKLVNETIHRELENFLTEKYSDVLRERKAYYAKQEIVHSHCNYVWFCWLQGLEQAPPIVQACYRSLKNNLTDREIKVIDEKNWREYVELPKHIVNRWEKKQIPPALFSDLLRLQLLIQYGGSWIDSTVLCTGVDHARKYLDANLFLFQYVSPENYPASFCGISNWFITSCTNNELLLVLRDMLYAYWADYDCTLYFFIFHHFFNMIAKEYPNEISMMPFGYSIWSLTLQRHWGEPFSQKKWDKLTGQVNFHKLTYRVDEKVAMDKENYYNWILKL